VRDTNEFVVMRAVAELLRGTMRVVLIDKPVRGAENGALTIFVGGEAKAFVEIKGGENATEVASKLAAHSVPAPPNQTRTPNQAPARPLPRHAEDLPQPGRPDC
jgi:hypothetical protein